MHRLNRSTPLLEQMLLRHKTWFSSWQTLLRCLCCSFSLEEQELEAIDSDAESELKLRMADIEEEKMADIEEEKMASIPITNIFDTSGIDGEKEPEQKVFYEPRIIDRSARFHKAPKSLLIKEEGPNDAEEGVEKYELENNQPALQTLEVNVKTRASKFGRNKTSHGARKEKERPEEEFILPDLSELRKDENQSEKPSSEMSN